MDNVIVAAALAASFLSLWWARGAAKQSSYLLFCQQRNDLILGLREVRDRLVNQAGHLGSLQERPLAALDAAHVRSLWDTVNDAVHELDALREQVEGWTQHRPSRETVHAAFDQLHSVSMQVRRVHRDVDELEERTPSEVARPAPSAEVAVA